MKAILQTAAGGPEVLQAAGLPQPALPGPDHLLVRLRAAGINPIDAKLRATAAYYPDRLPAVLGCDGAGVVEAVGAAVSRFRPGDEVYFFNGGLGAEPGNYAQYTTIHQDYAAAKPAALSMAQAAALPLALITAREALVERGRLEPGETVLIHGGAGGVGHLAVQLAKHLGARVATTVGDVEKAAFVTALGAERAIDYRRADFVQATLDWTSGQGAHLVLDTVGGETFCRSFGAARVYGRVVTLLQSACTPDQVKLARLRNLAIVYELMLTPLYLGMHPARVAQRKILEEGARLIEEGRLAVEVSQVLPLEQAAEAHRLIEAGHTRGKIVLAID